MWRQAKKEEKHGKRKVFAQMEVALMALKPEEMEITFMKVDKQNGMGPHGCTLSMSESTASPTFYLEDIYEAYRGGAAVKDIAEGVIEFAKANNLSTLPDGIDIGDYESIKKNLGLMVIGETANREYLSNMVYEKIEDQALLPIVFVNDARSTGCIKIRKDLLAIWGVTAYEVMEEARKNAPKSMPPMFKQLGDIIEENLFMALEDASIPEETELFVVNN